eukprot:TRINITY_DN49804_c0_g1_i1.p1 TRINITY_DN49804_c0_g1~~TRINITY_DN49804_c0_g1_i1.p1  ORF type:complete len:279 (-),score=42.46 TRINITY_DN49804_c0_g1_i1:149-985(-)
MATWRYSPFKCLIRIASHRSSRWTSTLTQMSAGTGGNRAPLFASFTAGLTCGIVGCVACRGEQAGQSGAKTCTNLPAAYERKVYIMRGMPGSGKSTLARSALRTHLESSGLLGGFERVPWLSRGFILSNDDFFETIDPTTGKPAGVDFGLIDPIVGKSAKAKNRLRCELAMELGMTPLFVDNGNTALWEMQEYVQLAQQHGYAVEILDAIKQQPGLTLEAVKRRAKERAAVDGKVIPEAGIDFTWQRYESNPLPDDAEAAVAEILKASPPSPPPPGKK